MADVYIGEVKIHPAAQMFPEMGQEDLDILFESIKRDGVQKPIIMYKDEVVDGRNRIRAARIAGIPFKQLPKVHLPDDADPYRVAWINNCERLDYQKQQKAEIHARILEESGKLEAMRKHAEDSRREKISATKKKAASKPESDVRHVAVMSAPEARPTQKERRKNTVAAQAAREAGVSQRTMERVLSKAKANGGPRVKKIGVPHDETWRVPRALKLLAIFLLQKLASDEIAKLISLLSNGGKEEAA